MRIEQQFVPNTAHANEEPAATNVEATAPAEQNLFSGLTEAKAEAERIVAMIKENLAKAPLPKDFLDRATAIVKEAKDGNWQDALALILDGMRALVDSAQAAAGLEPWDPNPHAVSIAIGFKRLERFRAYVSEAAAATDAGDHPKARMYSTAALELINDHGQLPFLNLMLNAEGKQAVLDELHRLAGTSTLDRQLMSDASRAGPVASAMVDNLLTMMGHAINKIRGR